MILWILNILVLLITIFIVKMGIDFNKGSGLTASDTYLLPSEINFLHKEITYLNRGILASLLNLKKRKKIDIEVYKRDSRNKTLEDFVIEYKFTLLNFEGLKDHEILFLQNIFQDKREVTTDELTQRAIDGNVFLKDQGLWANEIENELKSMGIISKTEKDKAKKLSLIGLVAAFIGIASLVNHNPLGLISLISSLAIFLIGLNVSLAKSPEGRYFINKFADIETKAKTGDLKGPLSEEELINLLALTLTMKYFIPIYEVGEKYETIDLVVDHINEYEGSYFDDAILRGFMGFTSKTRDDSLDTNRIDYRLFK